MCIPTASAFGQRLMHLEDVHHSASPKQRVSCYDHFTLADLKESTVMRLSRKKSQRMDFRLKKC